MQRLQEKPPLQSLGKVPAPNPGRLLLLFPANPAQLFSMCWRAKGRQKSLTEAELELYIRKVALSQPEMLCLYRGFAVFS